MQLSSRGSLDTSILLIISMQPAGFCWNFMANSIFKIRDVLTWNILEHQPHIFLSFFLWPLTWPPGGVALLVFYRPVRLPVGVEETYSVCISLCYPHVQPSQDKNGSFFVPCERELKMRYWAAVSQTGLTQDQQRWPKMNCTNLSFFFLSLH